MKMKKLIASLMIAVVLAVGCFSVIGTASAGSIFDTIASVAKTAVHAVKTAGNAIKGAALDAFTDTPTDECYQDMNNSIDKMKDNAGDILKNGKKIGTDFVDLAEGTGKMVTGALGTVGAAVYETEEWIRTGKKDYSYSSQFVDTMKDGYKEADNGLLTDVAIIASTACGVPSYVVAGAQLAKSGTEWAVGYKDGETAGKEMIAAGVSALTGGVCKGMDVSAVTNTAANYVTGTATQITMDLTNSKDNRSAVDIVLEDAAVSAAKTAALKGVGKAGEAVRGNNAANNAAEENVNAEADNASNVAVDENMSVSSESTADTVSVSSENADISFDAGVVVPVENEI